MSRNRLFLVSGALAIFASVCLVCGLILLHKDIGSYIASHYREYSRDTDGTRYACNGSPQQVADALTNYQAPQAHGANGGTQYLRYSDNIVVVGADGSYPCSIRVENLGAGYSHGSFLFLGPGFTPGSPSGGSGGSPGGPGGAK